MNALGNPLTDRPTLTSQQKDIIQFAPPPNSRGKILRVTAGAGTGKTTTVIQYANELVKKGHEKILYLTFNKNATRDASNKFQSSHVECKTLHRAAFSCIGDTHRTLLNDHETDDLIRKLYSTRIERFLSLLPTETRSQKSKKNSMFTKVVLFIRKTLITFLQRQYSKDDWTPFAWWAVYYPAQKFHRNNTERFSYPEKYQTFYVSTAKDLYAHLESGDTTTFDTVMKQVQLAASKLSYTAILVDESQDLNACQIDWISNQRLVHGTHIVLVGDPAQSIYGFRGAKSNLLLEMRDCTDKFLTVTHRFCPRIANIANTILFCKENSPQTTDNSKQLWLPYRLTGGAATSGVVTTASLLDGIGNTGGSAHASPVTVLAFSNVELLEICIEHLFTLAECDEESDLPSDLGRMNTTLKIAVNGDGENSGKKGWLSIQGKIKTFYNVYTGSSTKLPYSPWKENPQQELNWQIVQRDVEDAENADFSKIVGIINKFGLKTMTVFENFKRNIIEPNHDPLDRDVDVILSTIHGAKGMEWDNVQLFASALSTSRLKLNKYSVMKYEKYQNSCTLKRNHHSGVERFIINYDSYGDGLNLWYVALTRAKKVLSVPVEFMHLIQDFDYFLKSQNPVCNLSRDIDFVVSKRVKIEPEERSVDSPPANSPTGEIVSRNYSPQRQGDIDPDAVVPRIVSLDGQYREPTSAELISLHNSLAKPWADEMMAASGGLEIDGENHLGLYVNGRGSMTQSQPQEVLGQQSSVGSSSTILLTPPNLSLRYPSSSSRDR